MSKRLELVRELRRSNFYVRWHAYEFLLGYGGRLVGVLLLEPSRSRATLYCRRDAPLEEIEKAVRKSLAAAAAGRVELIVRVEDVDKP